MPGSSPARSGNGGSNCAEVVTAPGTTLVRDSKDKDSAELAFSAGAWNVFTDQVKPSLASIVQVV